MDIKLRNNIQVEALKVVGFTRMSKEKQQELTGKVGVVWGNILNRTSEEDIQNMGGAGRLVGLLAQLAKNTGLCEATVREVK